MAAEKLTKGRLGQIIIMMMVLIAAFTYRTVTYEVSNTQVCEFSSGCEVKLQEKLVVFMYQDSTNTLMLTKPEELTVKASIVGKNDVLLTDKSEIAETQIPMDIIITDQDEHTVKIQLQ
ncbi:hypothetical protein MD535_00055 [Vibrio sp. ZSDZ65]|uniref:NusG domain-containing protein n=1 Tax=Vibrio qingdaonensis TaxID=2829491 RepID=A0A9X3HUF9_9VIBR|nr:hypothetical protein [Vibrio qingdaonensis]MCW8344420.1 hypothetical protein [Vibrio qingdaonensis]